MERRSKSAKGQNTKLPNYKKLQITRKMERRSKSAKGQNTKLPNYKKLQITNYKNKILISKVIISYNKLQ